ncbi:MAG: VOC family protein, partial [Hyphomicrobiaceae bacterium]
MTTAKSYATCLWFDREAEDAANYYCSVLDDARITAVSRYGK